MATKKSPKTRAEKGIKLPITAGRVPGLNNFRVEGYQKDGDILKLTVSFTVKDGEKIPRDAGPSLKGKKSRSKK